VQFVNNQHYLSRLRDLGCDYLLGKILEARSQQPEEKHQKSSIRKIKFKQYDIKRNECMNAILAS
jgi:hypothetical protein